MTANQYRRLLDSFGLTQSAAAEILGVDPRTSRKWALGERPIPDTVAGFLNYLWRTRDTPAFDQLTKKHTA